jgi:uncharacterized protein
MDAVSKETRNWAMAAHLSSLSIYIGIPFGNILGPLIIWLVKRKIDPFIDEQGKEALNFQISILLYGLVAGALVLLLVGIPLLIALVIFDVVCVVLAAIRVSDGQPYRYPLCLRLVK